MATEKQVRYALVLLDKCGYSTEYMDAAFKRLGAKMNERRGRVREWLESMEHPRISALIDTLKNPPTEE
jgi:predicted Zn-dependent protease